MQRKYTSGGHLPPGQQYFSIVTDLGVVSETSEETQNESQSLSHTKGRTELTNNLTRIGEVAAL